MPVFNFTTFFMFNASRQLFRVLFLPILITSIFLSSCAKEPEYNMVGEWVIFPRNVGVLIIDDNAQDLLIQKITEEANEELRKLERIIIHPKSSINEGVAEFYYAGNDEPLSGKYLQNGAYFTVWNTTFPDGILGLCNSYELEIYYPREYIQNLLHSKGLDMQTVANFMDLFGLGYYLRKE